MRRTSWLASLVILLVSGVSLPAAGRPPGALIGDPLPKLRLAPVDSGKPIDLRQLGPGVVVFSFYSKYCRPCRRELPALHRAVTRVNASMRPKHPIRTVVLVRDLAPSRAARRRLGKTTLWLDDRAGMARRAFVPRRYPCTYLSAKGVIRKINRGFGQAYEGRVEGWLRQLVRR